MSKVIETIYLVIQFAPLAAEYIRITVVRVTGVPYEVVVDL
ncbi:hypothetical protein VB602_00035 [Vibrio parahaemolyticus]|nr:hypothetical protein [Vibrio parahaemolyticus]MEA5234681.1 hypothetical protein [Vibrio parahaemolyticus]